VKKALWWQQDIFFAYNTYMRRKSSMVVFFPLGGRDTQEGGVEVRLWCVETKQIYTERIWIRPRYEMKDLVGGWGYVKYFFWLKGCSSFGSACTLASFALNSCNFPKDIAGPHVGLRDAPGGFICWLLLKSRIVAQKQLSPIEEAPLWERVRLVTL